MVVPGAPFGILRHSRDILRCFERSLPESPTLGGQVVLQLEISEVGRVEEVTLRENELGETVGNCIIGRARRWPFDAPVGGTVTVSQRHVLTTEVSSFALVGLVSAYDEYGNLLTMERDEGVDGTFQERKTYTYDRLGNLQTMEWDNSADGTVDQRIVYTYDELGSLLTMERDNGPDGSVDQRITTYTYDQRGNLLTEEWDNNADSTVDGYTTYTYDCWD